MRLFTFLWVATATVFTVAGPSRLTAEDSKPLLDVKTELKLLEGTWKVVALEADGKKAPVEVLENMTWSFRGDQLSSSDPGNKLEDKATIKLDPNQSPKQIDLLGLTGTEKCKTIVGIYNIEDEKLVVCVRDAAAVKKGRPVKFVTSADSGLGLITLERIKK